MIDGKTKLEGVQPTPFNGKCKTYSSGGYFVR